VYYDIRASHQSQILIGQWMSDVSNPCVCPCHTPSQLKSMYLQCSLNCSVIRALSFTLVVDALLVLAIKTNTHQHSMYKTTHSRHWDTHTYKHLTATHALLPSKHTFPHCLPLNPSCLIRVCVCVCLWDLSVLPVADYCIWVAVLWISDL